MLSRFLEFLGIAVKKPHVIEKTSWTDILGERSKGTVEHKRAKFQVEPGVKILFEFKYEDHNYQLLSKRKLDDSLGDSFEKIADKMLKIVAHTYGLNNQTRSKEYLELMQRMTFRLPEDSKHLAESLVGPALLEKPYDLKEIIVNGTSYRIIRYPTFVSSFSSELQPIVGAPLISCIDFAENSHVTPNIPKIHWFVSESVFEEDDLPPETKTKRDGKSPKGQVKKPNGLEVKMIDETERTFSINGFSYRSAGPIFFPTAEDLNRKVALVADMGPDAPIAVAKQEEIVLEGPNELVTDNQAQWIRENPLEENCARLMSYNMLAASYLNLELEQNKLFYPFCEKQYQTLYYRYPLLLKQLKDLRSSIVFLQEVDQKMQLRYARVLYQEMGYGFEFVKKRLAVNEGAAIAYDLQLFELVSSQAFGVAELTTEYPENEDIKRILEASPENTQKIMLSRPTILQVLLLRCRKNGKLYLCGNTHLHHAPQDEQVKAFQGIVTTRKLLSLKKEIMAANPETDVKLLFGGDFNSVPTGPVYHLLTIGKLDKTYNFWKNDDKLVPEDLQLNETLDCLTGTPEFTNYTGPEGGEGFNGLLDYIWGQGVALEKNDV
ncbi:unnamed protein product [Caenorhabditis auriculariae]|uniref:Endonuclease/exonuclease/phosphatase domain-containing protein n=1 Tax=Caenorhabditis auriculariae TaxID=2777116 RepID=A0A8S1H4N7_9PELO|nr:unnamed protein product [Caenorhabditis auriculariae]